MSTILVDVWPFLIYSEVGMEYALCLKYVMKSTEPNRTALQDIIFGSSLGDQYSRISRVMPVYSSGKTIPVVFMVTAQEYYLEYVKTHI